MLLSSRVHLDDSEQPKFERPAVDMLACTISPFSAQQRVVSHDSIQASHAPYA